TRRHHVGLQKTHKTHAATQKRDDLGLIRHSRGEKYHSDKIDQRVEHVEVKRDPACIIFEGYLFDRSLVVEQILEPFGNSKDDHHHRKDHHRKHIGGEVLFDYISINDLHVQSRSSNFRTIVSFHSLKSPAKIWRRASPTSHR